MILILSIFLTINFAQAESLPELPRETLLKIHALGDQIVEGSEPGTTYIALGLSPLFVAADLEARLGPTRVARLPVSGVQEVVRNLFLMADGEDLLHHYFDHFLAAHIATGLNTGAKFEVVDWSSSGLSLESARRLLGHYFTWKGVPQNQVRFTALTGRVTQITERNADRIVAIDSGFIDLLNRRAFSDLRSYKKVLLDDWYIWFQNRYLFKSDLKTAGPLLRKKIQASFQPSGEANYQNAVQIFRQLVCEDQLKGNSI